MTILLSYAFRPFFLLMASLAIVMMTAWGLHLAGLLVWPGPRTARIVHGHEMLFGYTGGAIAGFLLTAVATWTGRPPVHGAPLLALCMAWLLARAGAWLPVTPGWAVWGLGNLVFWGGLLGLMAREVVGSRNVRNYKVLGVLTGFWLVEAVFFAASGHVLLQEACLRAGLFLVLGMISVVAGRIIPAFTQNWLRVNRPEIAVTLPGFDRFDLGVVLMTAAFAITFVLWPLTPATGWLGLLAGVAQAARLVRWRGWLTWREPLLWILHTGYAWISIGFLLLGFGILGDPPGLDCGLHALAYGAIGTLILGVAARVALGHTGRSLRSSLPMTVAFMLILLGTLSRLLVTSGPGWPWLSVGFWVGAHALFLGCYAPILLRPRVNSP